MFQTNQFNALNEEQRRIVPRDCFVTVSIQYPTGGTGTLQLQGRNNDAAAATDWFVIGVNPATGAAVATTMAAAGGFTADVTGIREIRLIMTVLGDSTVTWGMSSNNL